MRRNVRLALRHVYFLAVHRRRGWFRYFGQRVYFPPGSAVARYSYASGIHEYDVFRFITRHLRPQSWLIDVGANIGSHSLEALAAEPSVQVLSIEASPTCAPYLQRTLADSQFAARWQIVAAAAGETTGSTTFYTATGGQHAFDSRSRTSQIVAAREVTVPLTTIDREWQALGEPPVSVIKLDIEGGEMGALSGATACVERHRPAIVLEWDSRNLSDAPAQCSALLAWSRARRCTLLTLNTLMPVTSAAQLQLLCERINNYVLLPSDAAA